MPGDLLRSLPSRRGHFRTESGLHCALWLELDAMLAEPRRLAPFVRALAGALRAHAPAVICGPLVGGAFVAQWVARELDVGACYTERVTREERGLFGARYRLPRAFASRVRGAPVAIVDDAMSAGSSLRATLAELRTHDAEVVAAGALLVFGQTGVEYFASQRVPVEAVQREPFEMWAPDECPLCARGVPLEPVGT